MPNSHVIVGHINRLDPPQEFRLQGLVEIEPQPITVHFENEEIAHVAEGERYGFHRRTLAHFQRAQLPVYTEVDPENRVLTRLLIPTQGRVSNLFREAPGSEVFFHLDASPRPFRIPPGNPNYESYLHVLRDAQLEGFDVLVTLDEAGKNLVEIRRAKNPEPPAPLEFRVEAPAPESLMARSVTLDRARELFRLVAGFSCGVEAATAPGCIPFRYPDDGCHARAQAMCSLIIGNGDQPFKVWNFCSSVKRPLEVKTKNSPDCAVKWGFHVAVAMQIQNSSKDPQQIYVIDPALFDEPVPVNTWHLVQSAPDSCLAYTSPEPFLPPAKAHVEFDRDGKKTEKELARCRALLEQNIEQSGPPPYRNCA